MKQLSIASLLFPPCARVLSLLAAVTFAGAATGCGDDSSVGGPTVADDDATGGGLDGTLGGSDAATAIGDTGDTGGPAIDVIIPGSDVAIGGGDDTGIPTDVQIGVDTTIGPDVTVVPDSAVGPDTAVGTDAVAGPDTTVPLDIGVIPDTAVAPIITCVESACPTQVATCEADAACAKVLDCAKNCADQNCIFGCVGGGGFNLPAGLQDVYTCGNNAKCFAGGGTGPTNPVCGNGTCDPGETATSCPKDCTNSGTGGTNSCVGKCGQINTGGGINGCQCQSWCVQAGDCCSDYQTACGTTTTPTCGNGKCDPGETAANGPADCGGGTTTTPDQCVQAKCATQYAACAKDPACLAALPCVEGGKQIWNCNVTSVQSGLTLGQVQGCAVPAKCF